MEPLTYVSLAGKGESDFTIKKSHFLGHCVRAASGDEAVAFIKEEKDLFKDANHNIYAYKMRDGIVKCSDDGEPSGSAGLPVLDVINNMGLDNVAVVVTRYFGGILLGRGGLARAYSRAARDSLNAGTIATFTPFYIANLTFNYSIMGKLDNYLADKVYIQDKEFTDKVKYKFYIKAEETDKIFSNVIDFTSNRCIAELEQQVYLPVVAGKPII